jgi:hypothetical protein
LDYYKYNAQSGKIIKAVIKDDKSDTKLNIPILNEAGDQLAYATLKSDGTKESLFFSAIDQLLIFKVFGIGQISTSYTLDITTTPYDNGTPDTDSDCTNDITWGASDKFEINQIIGNWTLKGWVDGDNDGKVEQTDVTFSMEDIHCKGFDSLVIMMGNTSCALCPGTYSRFAEIKDDIRAQNSELLMYYGKADGELTIQETYNIISGYGMEGGYITAQKYPIDDTGLYATVSVVDMKTGKLLGLQLTKTEDVMDRVKYAHEH